jgi:hypothetical protein
MFISYMEPSNKAAVNIGSSADIGVSIDHPGFRIADCGFRASRESGDCVNRGGCCASCSSLTGCNCAVRDRGESEGGVMGAARRAKGSEKGIDLRGGVPCVEEDEVWPWSDSELMLPRRRVVIVAPASSSRCCNLAGFSSNGS